MCETLKNLVVWTISYITAVIEGFEMQTVALLRNKRWLQWWGT
jgi:hypothetical protein